MSSRGTALFYDRGGHRAANRISDDVAMATTAATDAGPPPPPDFNTILAHLGGQPELLRKLGLVIDFIVTPAGERARRAAGCGHDAWWR